MIVEITKDSINKLKDSFIDVDMIEQEFNNNPFARVLVMKEEAEIVGYIYFSDIYERAEINQFEINLIHRNCGKGNLLLKSMIELVEKDITLEVRANNKPALTLYEKNKFKKVAIRKAYYDGVDGILMERKYK